ncbi:MAG: hypothetical protein ACK4QP_01165 [Pseudorhizobium sp.]
MSLKLSISFRRTATALALLLVTFSAPADAGGSPSAKILFSGHSLLDNPLPDWVEMIARSQGSRLDWQEQIVIGSPVRVRSWGDGEWAGYSYGKNRQGDGLDIAEELARPAGGTPYDAVVLAEGHNLLGMILWENAIGYLRDFHDRLVAGNPRAKTFYYHSWLGLNKQDPKPWLAHEDNAAEVWQCVAEKVRLTLEGDDKPAEILILPAGSALAELVRHTVSGQISGFEGSVEKRLNRIFVDDVHLTDIGIYYLAAVTYASIFQLTPEGAAAPATIDAALARDLQSLAWKFAKDYSQNKAAARPSMQNCRQVLVERACNSYWTLKGEVEEARRCEGFFADTGSSSNNPFIWPDSQWKILRVAR